jgi:hypothetical protein
MAKPNIPPRRLPKAKRGVVTRNYETINTLAGFMDEQHFSGFAQEHIAGLTKREQAALFKKAENARKAAATLAPATDLHDVEIKPLDPSACAKITKDKTFQSIFGSVNHRFAWVRPEKLVALQVFVKSQKETIPKSKSKLVDFALPSDWNVPAEISFIPPFGPIYIVTSSPQMAGLEVSLDNKKGHVIMKPPSHINLIQVVQFNGRYYLKNGYHRTFGAVEAGLTELPALVVDAAQPADVGLFNIGLAGFSIDHSMRLSRPPLVSDFKSDCCVDIPMRERRYGASVTLQISPINIGV